MSDVSHGPGWWLASDGKWYPPESSPGPVPPDSIGHRLIPVHSPGASPQPGIIPPRPYRCLKVPLLSSKRHQGSQYLNSPDSWRLRPSQQQILRSLPRGLRNPAAGAFRLWFPGLLPESS